MAGSSGIEKRGGAAGTASDECAVAASASGPRNGGGRGLSGKTVEAQREAVIAYLRSRFRSSLSEDDFEDLTQEAWETMLEKRERGEQIDDIVAFTRSIAWRDARDLVRDRQEEAVDPGDGVFARIEDGAGSPEQQLDRRVDLVRAIEAVEQLEPEHRAAYRTRFVEGLSTKEACKRLGLPRSTYHHRLRRALDAVHAKLEPARFTKLQVKLLGAYVAGVASLPERRRAERLIRNDPQSAAIARELRGAHEATAAALTPVALDPAGPASVVERLAAVPGKLRDAASTATSRGQDAAEAAASPVAAGGGTRGAGAAGAGALAKLAGLGGAGKIAAACVGTGAAACIATGVVPGAGLLGEEPAPAKADRPQRVAETVEQSPPVSPDPVDDSTPADTSAPEPDPKPSEDPEEAEAPAPVAPSAPASEQEFGVVSAATPAGDGGGASSGSGGGSAFQREFGP